MELTSLTMNTCIKLHLHNTSRTT